MTLLLPADKITERTVRDRLLRYYSPYKDLVAFNLCGIGRYGHEMDFVRILKSGWAYEFEIKITAADIRADVAKKPEKYDELQNGIAWHIKSLYDEEFDPTNIERRPNQVTDPYVVTREGRPPSVWVRVSHPVKEFTVVVPTGKLGDVAVETMPAWVGVIVVDDRGPKLWRPAGKLKNARKITDAERLSITDRMTYRFWQMYFKHGGAGRA